MELWIILLRTIAIYFVVLFSMRMMGKREIGKLSVFDFVISVMIAEIAVIVIEDVGRPMIEGLLPMATLVIIQILIALLSLKNRKLRLWVDGPPSVIIDKGNIDRKEMGKQRYNLDDLMVQLRQNNVTNLNDVEFALLETTGKLTVIEKEQSSDDPQEKQKKPSNPSFRYQGLPLSLIMDGKVQDQHLNQIGKTRFWLKNQIQTKGLSDFKDVFLCTVDEQGEIYISKK